MVQCQTSWDPPTEDRRQASRRWTRSHIPTRMYGRPTRKHMARDYKVTCSGPITQDVVHSPVYPWHLPNQGECRDNALLPGENILASTKAHAVSQGKRPRRHERVRFWKPEVQRVSNGPDLFHNNEENKKSKITPKLCGNTEVKKLKYLQIL